jgi:hypothetical protein
VKTGIIGIEAFIPPKMPTNAILLPFFAASIDCGRVVDSPDVCNLLNTLAAFPFVRIKHR